MDSIGPLLIFLSAVLVTTSGVAKPEIIENKGAGGLLHSRMSQSGNLEYLGQVGAKRIYLTNTTMTWQKAHGFCSRLGFKLIRIENDQEFDFLYKAFRPHGRGAFWTSASNDFRVGPNRLIKAFKWTSLRNEGDYFPVFDGGEIQIPTRPRGVTLTIDTIFAIIIFGPELNMQVDHCSKSRGVLCQLEV